LESIKAFANYLKDNHGTIDVLVNNAAIACWQQEESYIEKDAVDTMNVNYFGTLNTCNELFPLLSNNARVVNVSSRLGLLSSLKNKNIKNKILDENLTIEGITQIVKEFIEACKSNKYKSIGYPTPFVFPTPTYSMSKIALNALSKVQQKQFDLDKTRHGIIVNSVCPGYCKSDLTRGSGLLSTKQGAESSVYLALLPEDFKGQKGVLYAENVPISFENCGIIGTNMGLLWKKIFG
jgi:carbonyl reductase 1